MMTEMMKGNITNVLPMIIIGGWINWAFSGFLTSEFVFHMMSLFIGTCKFTSILIQLTSIMKHAFHLTSISLDNGWPAMLVKNFLIHAL